MVLKTLDVLGPQHGYGIARRIEQISGDILALNQGTLYPLLLKLENKGSIASQWGASENNRRARFYRLIATGRNSCSGQPASIASKSALPSYFAVLGVDAQLGSTFDLHDATPGFNGEVVISNGLWKRAFGADPHILGKTLRLDNDPAHIVGVMPASFRGQGQTSDERSTDLWAAAGFSNAPPPMRGTRLPYETIARLLRRNRTIPSMEETAAGDRVTIPLGHSQNDLNMFPLIREGQDVQSSQPPLIDTSIVSPEYFHLLGMTVLRGRLFVDQDLEDTPSIAIINQAAAHRIARGRWHSAGLPRHLPAPSQVSCVLPAWTGRSRRHPRTGAHTNPGRRSGASRLPRGNLGRRSLLFAFCAAVLHGNGGALCRNSSAARGPGNLRHHLLPGK